MIKIDVYTKTVLTVIAICLSVNVLKELNLFPSAYAEKPATNLAAHLPAIPGNKSYGLVPVNADGTIDVHVKSAETTDVRIADVYWNAGTLDVKVINK